MQLLEYIYIWFWKCKCWWHFLWGSCTSHVHLRWGLQSGSLQLGLCGKECDVHGGRGIRLFHPECSVTIPILPGSLVRRNIHHSKDITCASVDPVVTIYRYALSFNRISDFKKPPVTDEDVDVAKERERIYNGGSPSDILQIKDLSKASLCTLQWCIMGNASHNRDHECIFFLYRHISERSGQQWTGYV